MKRTLGISTAAIAAAMLVTSIAMPALACMEMDEQASMNGPRVAGVPVVGVPVVGDSEPAVVNPGESYVILRSAHPGTPPKILRVGGIDVSPAPEVLVIDGRAVTQDAKQAIAWIDSPRVLQEAQLAN